MLARVASLFSRRGFNIESLAVGATELPGVSRMTIVVSVEDFPLEQVTKQLNKLVNVIKIVEQDPDDLGRSRTDAGQGARRRNARDEVIEAVNLFRAKVIDVSPESLTVEATGTGQARCAAADARTVRYPRDRPVGCRRRGPRTEVHLGNPLDIETKY